MVPYGTVLVPSVRFFDLFCVDVTKKSVATVLRSRVNSNISLKFHSIGCGMDVFAKYRFDFFA